MRELLLSREIVYDFLVPSQAVLLYLARANRTAAFSASDSAGDGGFPNVTVGTFPPDLAVGPRCHLFRSESAVQGRMPLGGQRWLQGSQVVKPLQDPPPRAVGTALPASTSPGINGRLPLMPLAAPPPDLFPASMGNALRCQRRVFFRIPFLEQVRFAVFQTLVIQGPPQHHPS